MKQYKFMAEQIYEILAKELNIPVEMCNFDARVAFDLKTGRELLGSVSVTISEDSDETNK